MSCTSSGGQFKSLTDSIDTGTPSGRFFFHVMASLAETERELIVERTRAGTIGLYINIKKRRMFGDDSYPIMGLKMAGASLVPCATSCYLSWSNDRKRQMSNLVGRWLHLDFDVITEIVQAMHQFALGQVGKIAGHHSRRLRLRDGHALGRLLRYCEKKV